MNDARERLTTELELEALRAVRATYGGLNDTFFKGRLKRPTLEFTDTASQLGCWLHEGRRLELSRKLLFAYGWGAVVEVLKHEMAHQFTDEVLGAIGETAHGPTFQQVCRERGFDARAVGEPGPGDGAESPVLDRIAKLLALAESANEHEAHAAMNAAQRLMLKHNLETIAKGPTEACSYRHVGEPTGRVSEAERVLANILCEHFFVDAIWVPVWRPLEGKRASVLEICGRLENLEMSEYVHSFLRETATRLWLEHKKRVGIRGNRDRRAYLAGVMSGFEARLEDQARANDEEGLVWAGDAAVGDYFRQRHPHVRWSHHVSTRGTHAHESGVEAGRKIVLHRGVKAGPSETVRALPPSRKTR